MFNVAVDVSSWCLSMTGLSGTCGGDSGSSLIESGRRFGQESHLLTCHSHTTVALIPFYLMCVSTHWCVCAPTQCVKNPGWTYCSHACSGSPCWSGVPRSVAGWGHRPCRWGRCRARERVTWRTGWRKMRWRCSLTWSGASGRRCGGGRTAPAGPCCSGWSLQARRGAAGCPPCLPGEETDEAVMPRLMQYPPLAVCGLVERKQGAEHGGEGHVKGGWGGRVGGQGIR